MLERRSWTKGGGLVRRGAPCLAPGHGGRPPSRVPCSSTGPLHTCTETLLQFPLAGHFHNPPSCPFHQPQHPGRPPRPASSPSKRPCSREHTSRDSAGSWNVSSCPHITHLNSVEECFQMLFRGWEKNSNKNWIWPMNKWVSNLVSELK